MSKRGYYLWDWYGTKTIKFDPDVQFHSEDYAKTQEAYRKFKDAKKSGIDDLKQQISDMRDQLGALKALRIEDVKP